MRLGVTTLEIKIFHYGSLISTKHTDERGKMFQIPILINAFVVPEIPVYFQLNSFSATSGEHRKMERKTVNISILTLSNVCSTINAWT